MKYTSPSCSKRMIQCIVRNTNEQYPMFFRGTILHGCRYRCRYKVLVKGNIMRETEKFAKTMNDGMDNAVKIFKWLVIISVVIILGGATIGTLLS